MAFDLDLQEDRPWWAHYPEGVPRHLEYPEVGLAQFLIDTARRHPERVATQFFGAKLTYRQLLDQVRRFAAGLRRLGVGPGDRVAVMLPNSPQAVIAYYATLWLGAVVVMVNPLHTPRELRHQLEDAELSHVVALDLLYRRVAEVAGEAGLRHIVVTSIADYLPFPLSVLYPIKLRREGHRLSIPYSPSLGDGVAARAGGAQGGGPAVHRFKTLLGVGAVAEPEPVRPREDLALLQYTGGTTGTPKAAMLTHFNLVANCTQIAAWMNRFEDREVRIVAVLPFFHVYGMTAVMNYGIRQAATLLLVPRFEVKQLLRLIHKERPTVFPGAPTMYVAINSHPEVSRFDLSSIEACISGAAPLPLDVQQTFERLTGGRLVEGYGLTEASPVTHCNPIWGRRKEGSIGLPWPDTDCRILDPETGEPLPSGEVGELAVKGPQVMQGYWKRPEETAAVLREGWLLTGDLARMDEEGYFYIVDRKKDLIIAGGFNIYPREVEEVLYEHPAVLEAAVIGVPDPYRGETVKAFVVFKAGQQATAEEIIAFCRERLAAYKVPRIVEFRGELPKTLVGKVLRRVLAEEERAKAAERGETPWAKGRTG